MEHVLITGSNRGIGLEFTRQYLERGAQVFAGCRQPAAATSLRTLQAKYPQRLSIMAVGGMLCLIDALTPGHNGRFLTWQGDEHDW